MSTCLVCCLARELLIHSIFLHNFMKGAEREEEFSDTLLRRLALKKGDTQHLLLTNCWLLLCKS